MLRGFFDHNKLTLLQDLEHKVAGAKDKIRKYPRVTGGSQYVVLGINEVMPTTDTPRHYEWAFQIGDANDVHSEAHYVAGDIVHLDTDPRDLLQNLIDDIHDQGDT